MAYSAQDNTQYLDPITSEYYTMQQNAAPSIRAGNFMGGGFMGGGGYNGGMSGGFMGGGYNAGIGRYQAPQPVRVNTGDISMVNRMLQNRQPYQYNVPSMESMFPSMTMPTMGNFQPNEYYGGVSQFLGGLLGNAPMTASNEAPAAMSSGAGRFL